MAWKFNRVRAELNDRKFREWCGECVNANMHPVRGHPQNMTILFMRVCTNKNEENEKNLQFEGPSTKYDHFIRVSMDENEENE